MDNLKPVSSRGAFFAARQSCNNLLDVQNLKVDFYLDKKIISAVEDVSFNVRDKEILCLAGESGSGKTITALAITKVLPQNAKIVSGAINFQGRDLLKLDNDSLSQVRGKEISYVFQEPSSYLNPVFTIGSQIVEAIMLHQNKTKKQAKAQAEELLNLVKIKDPKKTLADYPHQLSGGMNQRAFIAMALGSMPRILIADEPTTSLDVTIEARILELLMDLKNQMGFSMIFITHNLSIAKRIADRVYVMYKGRVVEEAATRELFNSPKHFHTQELIKAYEKIKI